MPCGRNKPPNRFAAFWKEKRAHPKMSDKQIWMIVNDHLKKKR
jgi:hypothetical protein